MSRLQNRFATSPRQDSIVAGLEPAHFNLESYCFILKILQLRVFAGGVYGVRTREIPDRQSGGVDHWPNTPMSRRDFVVSHFKDTNLTMYCYTTAD